MRSAYNYCGWVSCCAVTTLFFHAWMMSSAEAGSQHCTYYGDRQSAPESNLANCSWFGKNACCKRTEVTSVFSEMFRLFGATKECEDRMSYLMCYFCSPDQEIWFREKATICRSFCDSIYEHCADAWYEDRLLRDVLKDGKEKDGKEREKESDGGFCRDNFFDVVDGEKDCYKFDPVPFSAQNRLRASYVSAVLLHSTAALITLYLTTFVINT